MGIRARYYLGLIEIGGIKKHISRLIIYVRAWANDIIIKRVYGYIIIPTYLMCCRGVKQNDASPLIRY